MGTRSPAFSAVSAFPRIVVLVGFVAIIGGGRTLATVLGAAGGGVVFLSILADDLGLGPGNGVFGRWQLIGVIIGAVAVFGAVLWHKRMNDLDRITKRDRSSEPEDGQSYSWPSSDLSWWFRRGIWAGGVAVALSLYLGEPGLGGGVLGWWRIALIAVGLVAIGSGLIAMLWHSVWGTAVTATLVVVTVAALGLAVLAWDQVPPAPPSCSEIDGPTVERGGPVYCYEGNGTLVRKSIDNMEECSYTITVARRRYRQLLPEWGIEWNAVGCRL